MVKKPFIVVLRLEGPDLTVNEVIEVTQGLLNRLGNAEVHTVTVIPTRFASAPRRNQE